MFRNLWEDDGGSALVTGEILFIFAILLLGIISGLVAMRQAVISELVESAQALMALLRRLDGRLLGQRLDQCHQRVQRRRHARRHQPDPLRLNGAMAPPRFRR